MTATERAELNKRLHNAASAPPAIATAEAAGALAVAAAAAATPAEAAAGAGAPTATATADGASPAEATAGVASVLSTPPHGAATSVTASSDMQEAAAAHTAALPATAPQLETHHVSCCLLASLAFSQVSLPEVSSSHVHCTCS